MQTFGEPGDPAILLVAGASAAMDGTDGWEPEFCERLAAGSRLVVRYETRDSGGDPVAAAVGVLDALGVARAHVVGISVDSTNGGTGERLALEHAGRVASLTLIATAGGPGGPGGPGGADLPAPLVDRIPDVRLLPVETVDHGLPRSAWDAVIPAILWHTSGGWGRQADVLATKALAGNDPTGWFERLYAAADAGEVPMPWDREGPREALREWASQRALTGDGRRALVIGCGLGGDSEYIGGLGFDTDAFDISETAIRTIRARYPDSPVRYRTADLFDPPTEWIGAFDLVVEIFTVQALPVSLRRQAIAAVRRLVGPGGTLIAIMAARDADDGDEDGPPWPLTRAEMESFATDGLNLVRMEEMRDPRLWRAEFQRGGRRRSG